MTSLNVDEKSLLVIILDVHPCQKIITNHHRRFHQVVEALVAFSNGHLLMKPDNKLAILACHSGASDYIYADKDYAVVPTGVNDGQYELFAHVEKCIRKNIKDFIARMDPTEGESLLAGSCAMALCYIQRMVRELPIGEKMNSRILILTGSKDSASQYMNYMNVFFTAQKENVVLDVCTLDHHQGLLQQGCDITGGIYLKTPQPQGVLQYLMWVFLPEPPLRKKLVLPPPVKVDYRAACFCHRQLIDIGYVCSICLSIFCKFSPICTTCHALFKTAPLPSKPKKKKIQKT